MRQGVIALPLGLVDLRAAQRRFVRGQFDVGADAVSGPLRSRDRAPGQQARPSPERDDRRGRSSHPAQW